MSQASVRASCHTTAKNVGIRQMKHAEVESKGIQPSWKNVHIVTKGMFCMGSPDLPSLAHTLRRIGVQ